jgi:hypothetical protein
MSSRTIAKQAADNTVTRKQTKAWVSPMAEVLFNICEEQGRPIPPVVANGVIEKVEIYLRELGMKQSLTPELLQSTVRTAGELNPEHLIDALENAVATLRCEEDRPIADLADQFETEGLNKRDAVLRACKLIISSYGWL